jgi:CBS-domain-containing membrane protein
MSYKGALIKSLDAASPETPMVGEVAFFAAAEQPFSVVVDESGYVV